MRDPDLDAAYDFETSVSDPPTIQTRCAEACAALTSLDSAALDLAYGPDPQYRLDIRPPPDGAWAASLHSHGRRPGGGMQGWVEGPRRGGRGRRSRRRPNDDLRAAAARGLRTAFIGRPVDDAEDRIEDAWAAPLPICVFFFENRPSLSV